MTDPHHTQDEAILADSILARQDPRTPASTYLIIGGTGKTGRRVVHHLRAARHEVRAASRNSETTPFDWAVLSTHPPAVTGVDAVFLTVAGQDPSIARHVAAFLRTAAEAGIRRAVLLSARAVEFRPDGALAVVERAVADAPLAHTILRPSWFAQNFTEGFLAPDSHGVITAPTGDGLEPFIDLEDLAKVAATALINDGPDGTIHLSGSQTLSFGHAVAHLAQRTQHPLRFTPADPDHYRSKLADRLPPEYVAWRMAMFDAIREGRDGYTSNGVEDILGRPARRFCDWAASLEPTAVNTDQP